MLVYGKCECFVMHMVYVYVLCASCGSSQGCVLHDLQFVNAGRVCKGRKTRSYDCLVSSHRVSNSVYTILLQRVFLLFVEACVLVLRCCECDVSFGSKVRPRTFGCIVGQR